MGSVVPGQEALSMARRLPGQHRCARQVLSPVQGPGGAGGLQGELQGDLGLELGPAQGGGILRGASCLNQSRLL